jgi:hypothetical protein
VLQKAGNGEHGFRTAKSRFAARPLFHKLDETIRGHETKVEQGSKRFVLRAVPRPAASLALRAVALGLLQTVYSIVEG